MQNLLNGHIFMPFYGFVFTSYCHLDTNCRYKKKWAQHNAEPTAYRDFGYYFTRTFLPSLILMPFRILLRRCPARL